MLVLKVTRGISDSFRIALVRFASVRFASFSYPEYRFALVRSAPVRFASARVAVGPRRYPLVSCQSVGRAKGVPAILPERTPVSAAVAKFASV